MRNTYKGLITNLKLNEIFVFGSNTQGRHGAGAAKMAADKFGAIYGQSMGLQGQSYAIVTKDLTKNVHPSISKGQIQHQIEILYKFAMDNKDKTFYVAYSGTGTNLNGYSNKDMASMFRDTILAIPDNIVFEEEFNKLIFNE